ncbi:MAG: trypsin-like peptidase domain-containing protein [Bacteroidaceae bacterium]|nr:trypsin-like peptidase domain-containing protein [Bacteroidaceae bacterium]
MRKILFLLMVCISVNLYSQISETPYVKQQKNAISIYAVSVNSECTAVNIDFQDYILSGGKSWIRIKSNTFLQYTDPDSGEIMKEKAIGVERLINNQGRYEESVFDVKYDYSTDFGGRPVRWMMRVFFPPIPVGVREISIMGESTSDPYWYGIQIEECLYPEDEKEANEILQEIIEGAKSIYAGKYEGLDDPWKLAFVESEGHYALLNREKLVGWDIMSVWATLTPTAYPNIFKGRRIISNRTQKNITVAFDDGVMTIKEEDGESQYIRMEGRNTSNATTESITQWSGSGFALKDGYVVTNYHVAGEAKTIEIFGVKGDFSKGYKATIVGVDKVSDLSLLKISDKDFSGFGNPPYAFKSSMVDVGENVYVLGYPLTQTMGEEVKLTNGIVSSRSGYEGNVTTYQISVPVQPGNSGGPMFDMKGNLVGIVCAKHADAENANYAIKTSYLKNLVESVASSAILPTISTINGKELKEQVKQIKNFVYLIKCSNTSDESLSSSGNSTPSVTTVNSPTVRSTTAERVKIKSVYTGNDYTSVTLEIPYIGQNQWCNIDGKTYIMVDGITYTMTKAEGIKIAPERTTFTNDITFTLYFPPIPASTTSIDLIESEDSSWKFYGIKIK